MLCVRPKRGLKHAASLVESHEGSHEESHEESHKECLIESLVESLIESSISSHEECVLLSYLACAMKHV